MDDRWYRTDSDMFGPIQQAWYENLIFNESTNIDFHVVSVGSTCLIELTADTPEKGFNLGVFEGWPNATKVWFFNVTNQSGILNRTILLTGDVHYSSIHKKSGTQFIEITSSSITHTIESEVAAGLLELDTIDRISGITSDNSFAIIDMGPDIMDIAMVKHDGSIIYKLTYYYNNDSYTYVTYEASSNKDLDDYAWFWVVIAIAILIFICIIASLIYCLICGGKHLVHCCEKHD